MMVCLNEAEQRLAKYCARARFESNRASGVADAKRGPQSTWETDLEGIAAEIAFCKLMNVFPDLQTAIRQDADAVTKRHGLVDVKATKFRNGKLLAVPSKAEKAPDSYALMIGQFPSYRFVGWATSDELLNDDNLTDLGHGPVYAMEQNRLRAVE